MRKFLIASLLMTLFNLSYFTVDADRIYTVCKYDNGIIYCYNNDENFYRVSDDALIKVGTANLKAKPCLQFIPTKGDYKFEYILPGLYRGTLTSVYHYSSRLLNTDNSSYEVTYSDCNMLEVYIYSEEFDVRIIYNILGDVRVYAVDNSDNPIEPPYLIDK